MHENDNNDMKPRFWSEILGHARENQSLGRLYIRLTSSSFLRIILLPLVNPNILNGMIRRADLSSELAVVRA